jgi:hypothetical protein
MAVVLHGRRGSDNLFLDDSVKTMYLLGKHAETARDSGKVPAWNHRRGLVADTKLEASRAPISQATGDDIP